jgi:hypothetical protein
MNYTKPKKVETEPQFEPQDLEHLTQQVEEELQKAGHPPPLTPPPTMGKRSGADELIETAERAISGAHDAVILHLDEMITRLQSVKESVKAKRDSAVAALREFVGLSAIGLDTVRELDAKVKELVRNHLTLE